MVMNENDLKPEALTREPARPLRLGARTATTGQLIARRVMPDHVPDDGVAPLDVAAFTSSI